MKKALKRKPNLDTLNNSFDRLLHQLGSFYIAIFVLQKAVKLYPNCFWLRYNLGKVYFRQKRFDEAINSLQQAIHLNSLSPEAQNKLGEVLLEKGEISQSITCFQKAIAISPHSAWYYQNLGNAKAQMGSFNESRSCYTHAIQINPDEVKRYHNSLFIKPCSSKDMVKNPIFIVGCGHSGTSIMLAILSSHPSLHPIPKESNLFMKSDCEIRATLHQWDRKCREVGKKCWVEKTPTHIFQIGQLSLYRPEAQFILMLRDGRDVACSLKARQPNGVFSTMVDRWIYDNLAGLQYWNDYRVKVVKYESLVVNPATTLKDVCEFLQEDYTSSMLDYHKTPRFWYGEQIQKPETHIGQAVHTQLRNWQINQPIFDGRGKWKTEMNEQEKIIFKDKAQKYLEQFGYVDDDSW
ncbi:tetratricopeptide repeat protein [Lyngbya sp. CCY1209]|uniref:tetratricopeptide repeat-containing sulfotransferase family protein n=1 Tax=Lyngbya sp. CCY1209 TaxID=2886103 RepID=UPI002D209EF0|nr:tetratricopeptide repeat protein [Lyngbya sp. CCY1209]MEB3884959.1 tetratricopeptide repeat protein [Lyngbya sp. CCY1209]